jgi:hypothetical protein
MKKPSEKDHRLLEDIIMYLVMQSEPEVAPDGERIMRIRLDNAHAIALTELAADILERRQETGGMDSSVGVIRMGLN